MLLLVVRLKTATPLMGRNVGWLILLLVAWFANAVEFAVLNGLLDNPCFFMVPNGLWCDVVFVPLGTNPALVKIPADGMAKGAGFVALNARPVAMEALFESSVVATLVVGNLGRPVIWFVVVALGKGGLANPSASDGALFDGSVFRVEPLLLNVAGPFGVENAGWLVILFSTVAPNGPLFVACFLASNGGLNGAKVLAVVFPNIPLLFAKGMEFVGLNGLWTFVNSGLNEALFSSGIAGSLLVGFDCVKGIAFVVVLTGPLVFIKPCWSGVLLPNLTVSLPLVLVGGFVNVTDFVVLRGLLVFTKPGLNGVLFLNGRAGLLLFDIGCANGMVFDALNGLLVFANPALNGT